MMFRVLCVLFVAQRSAKEVIADTYRHNTGVSLTPPSPTFSEKIERMLQILYRGIGGNDELPQATKHRVHSIVHLSKREEYFIAALLDPSLRAFDFVGGPALKASATYENAKTRIRHEANQIALVSQTKSVFIISWLNSHLMGGFCL